MENARLIELIENHGKGQLDNYEYMETLELIDILKSQIFDILYKE